MSKPKPRLCPCHSDLALSECCGPFIEGTIEAPDPVAMMRSRYSAFALGEGEYLWRTLHEAHTDRALPRGELVKNFRGAHRTVKYMRLAILDSRWAGTEGEVLFCAGIFEKGRDHSFVELSDFAHDGTGWRYRSCLSVLLRDLGRSPEGLTIDAFRTGRVTRG